MKPRLFPLLLISTLLLAACGGGGGPAAAIQGYLQALVERDAEALAAHSCAAWEADARTELNSFSAVTISLQDAACQEGGVDGEFTLVNCTGKIVANYGSEVLEIDLSARTYQAVNEAGDWRMCGYR